jgi:putative hydrolase
MDNICKYRLISDLHTHTIFSHGKGSIEDNVQAAREKGLKTLGITDHGPDHFPFGIKRSSLLEMRKIIDGQNALYDDITVLLGVEANITGSPSGSLSLTDEDRSCLDYIIAGYHFGGMGDKPFSALCLHLRNLFAGKNCSKNHKLYAVNTENTIRAIKNNKLKILTHPHDKINEDLVAIAQACEEAGTLLEINSSHLSMSGDEISEVASKTGVQFVLSSDAHRPSRVGDIQPALALAAAAGLDFDRIVNIEKT